MTIITFYKNDSVRYLRVHNKHILHVSFLSCIDAIEFTSRASTESVNIIIKI